MTKAYQTYKTHPSLLIEHICIILHPKIPPFSDFDHISMHVIKSCHVYVPQGTKMLYCLLFPVVFKCLHELFELL